MMAISQNWLWTTSAHARPLRQWSLALFVTLAWPALARTEVPQENAAKRTIRGTAVIKVGEGQGTGWLFNRERRLLLTNLHVVTKSAAPSDAVLGLEPRYALHSRVLLIFPAYLPDGSLIPEAVYYQKKQPELMTKHRIVSAEVIDFDSKRDLAVLLADQLPDDVRAIPLAAQSQQPGDSHFLIGHPGISPLYWRNAPGTAVSRGFHTWTSRSLLGHAFTNECESLLTRAKIPPGTSGGPLVNTNGELVAVATNAAYGNEPAKTIDLAAVRAYIEEIEILVAAKTLADVQQRGRRYLDRGQIDKAETDFREVHLRRAEMPDLLDEDLLDLAEVTRIKRQFKESLEWCEKALAEKNRHPGRAYAERAATRLRQIPENALAAVDVRGPLWRPRNHPDRQDSKYLKSVTEAQNKHDKLWEPRRQAVLDDVTAALKEDPRSILALRTRAQLLSRMSSPDHRQILADRTAVVRLLNNSLGREPTSLLERARAYRDAEQYDKAIADCEAAIKISPRSVLGHFYLASILLAARRESEAFDVATKLVMTQTADGQNFVSMEPVNPANFDLVALISQAAGDHPNVIGAIDGAILRSEKDMYLPPLRRHYVDRGDAHAALKQYEKARSDYRKAIKISDAKADQRPDCDAILLYQQRYSLPVIEKKLRALP